MGHHGDEAAASTLILVEASHKQTLTFHISNSHSPRNIFSRAQRAHTHGIQYLFIFSDNARSFFFSQLFLFLFSLVGFLSLSPGPTSLCHPIISFNYGLPGARAFSCFPIVVVKQQRSFSSFPSARLSFVSRRRFQNPSLNHHCLGITLMKQLLNLSSKFCRDTVNAVFEEKEPANSGKHWQMQWYILF